MMQQENLLVVIIFKSPHSVLILVEGHIPGMKKAYTLDGMNSCFCMIFNQKSSSSRSHFIWDSIYIFSSLGFKENTILRFHTISINPTFAPRLVDIKFD